MILSHMPGGNWKYIKKRYESIKKTEKADGSWGSQLGSRVLKISKKLALWGGYEEHVNGL